MNTSALKTFTPAVRRQLMEAVTRKLDFALSAKTPDFLTTYASQIAALRKLEQADRTGLIERVAYTWFNRLAALRFMDARGWHPFRARVLTAASADETQTVANPTCGRSFRDHQLLINVKQFDHVRLEIDWRLIWIRASGLSCFLRPSRPDKSPAPANQHTSD